MIKENKNRSSLFLQIENGWTATVIKNYVMHMNGLLIIKRYVPSTPTQFNQTSNSCLFIGSIDHLD